MQTFLEFIQMWLCFGDLDIRHWL